MWDKTINKLLCDTQTHLYVLEHAHTQSLIDTF